MAAIAWHAWLGVSGTGCETQNMGMHTSRLFEDDLFQSEVRSIARYLQHAASVEGYRVLRLRMAR